MEKFEALFGGKKTKKDDKKPDSPEKKEQESSDMEKAVEIKKEIGEITGAGTLKIWRCLI